MDLVRLALLVVVALARSYVVARRMGLSLEGLFAGDGRDGSNGVGKTVTRFVPLANVAALDPLLARAHGGRSSCSCTIQAARSAAPPIVR